MTGIGDELEFAEGGEAPLPEDRWKILIVAGHPSVHAATRMALSHVTIHGRALEFRAAFTEGEACRILAQERDIALVLCDMVLEGVESGLNIARALRTELSNPHARIVLCTADYERVLHPDIRRQLDISAFKERSTLTHDMLYEVAHSAIGDYRARTQGEDPPG